MLPPDLIPEEKIAAVDRALCESFGAAGFDEITRITKGQTSSLVFRIVVRGSAYLLKIITREEDPARHYRSMRAAAEACIAPRVLYTSVPDRISITDFVEAVPLSRSEALVRLPRVLRALHSLPQFDRAPFNTTCTFLLTKGPFVDGFLQEFQAANILPKPDREEFFARLAELAVAYPYDDTEMVSSHNDLFKPDNILFDGKQVWLVDWEAAFLNDRYADLAAVANQVITNEQEELALLEEYFGAPPNTYQQARFHLMRQIAHLFYTMAFLQLGSISKPIDWSGPVPEFTEYHQGMWAGEVGLSDNDAKVAYGRVHWERLLHNVRQDRYRDALRVVAGRREAP